MKILLIKDQKELKDVIDFLKLGFNWSQEKAYKIKKILISQKKEYNFYGYYAIEDEVIIGAFLLFYQGYCIYQKKELKILNISSWYVIPKFRVTIPILMIKKLIQNNSEKIITNLTPTVPVQNILKVFGFRKNNSHNIKFNFLDVFVKNLSELRGIKKINILENNFKELKQKTNFSLKNLNELKIISNNNSFSIIFAETEIEKNFKIINLKFKGIRILWTSDYESFSKDLFQIILMLLIRKKCIFCTIHCELTRKFKKYEKDNYQLFLLPKNYDYKYFSENIALGSELNFI